MQRRLRATKGPLAGALYVISRRRTTIGRGGDVDIQVLSKGVSRRHCYLDFDGQTVTLIDDGSTNGTHVDGKRVRELPLTPGLQFRIGDAVFAYEEDIDGLIEGPPTEELDLKVASGPAMEGTVAYNPKPAPADSGGCTHPLHALARESGWKHCPNCGGSV